MLSMILVEFLSTPLASSNPSYSGSRQNSLYKHSLTVRFPYISTCAYIHWEFKQSTKIRAAELYGRFLLPKSLEVYSSRISKVSEIEFESVCEDESEYILKESDSLGESSSSDHDVEERSNSITIPKTRLGNNDDIEGEIHYLEERDEEILSQRLLKLSRSNKIRSALALYKSMELSGLTPNPHACNSLLTCVIRNGRLEDALKLFYSMKETDILTRHTYSLVIKAFANASNFDTALRIFEEALGDVKTKKYMDAIVYNTMITIFAKSNNWVMAERMWITMQENKIIGTVVTYRLLVCVFVRCGQNELALDAYHEMVRNELEPSDDAMQAIIGACTREGKWDMALNVMQSMLNNDMKPSLLSCNALINSLGKAGEVDLAFKVYSLVKELGYTPDAYTWNALLNALNRANRHSDAFSLFENVREENGSVLNLHMYNTCLISCQKLGYWEKAVQLLWKMEEVGFPISVTSYNLVIGACETARKPKIALQIYKHMVQRKQFPDIFTPLSLIRACIWGSLWDEVEEILNSAPNGYLYNAAIQGMCLRKKLDLAKKLYKQMREMGIKPDGKTRSMMLQNLPRS